MSVRNIHTQEDSRRAALVRVRAALQRVGYTRDAVRDLLQSDQHLTAQPGEVVIFERRLMGGSALENLIRLFVIGHTLPVAELKSSLGAEAFGNLEAAGLLEDRGGGACRTTVRLVPHGDIFVACDRAYYGDTDAAGSDVVTGVTSPAVLLADLTVRKAAGRALDLGTGGGIQALLLAKHCDQVVAVDVNPRAIDFCRLNTTLNGIENVEARLGSWFEPVAGETFDIITANPPYVMSPDTTYLYRDSGMKADSLCRQIIRDMPRHLSEGGFGHILISWALKRGEDWSAPLRRWIEGLDCDFWLLHYLTEDPLTQAGKWNQGAVASGLPEFGAALDRWTDYYRAEGIEEIAFGAVIMRKRTGGDNWVRADSFHAGKGSSAGLLLRVFEAEDFVRSLARDELLLDEVLVLVRENRLEQRLRFDNGEWQQLEASLTLTQGISFSGSLDLTTAHLLQQLDGLRTLREAVAATVSLLEIPPGDVESLEATAVAMVKRLLQLGFFERVQSPAH